MKKFEEVLICGLIGVLIIGLLGALIYLLTYGFIVEFIGLTAGLIVGAVIIRMRVVIRK